MIVRHGPPGKLDTEPMGTMCKVVRDGSFDVYIQIWANQEEPNWVLIDSFTEESFNIYLQSTQNKSTVL